MKNILLKIFIILSIITFGVIWNGNINSPSQGMIEKVEARAGRPASPVSYAGVARRTTVKVATPGAGAPGRGVAPGNRGGPVNRVGRR
jgi:hypothetical protein